MPLRACLSLALLLFALDARAQNLIPNPSFSDLFMLGGWNPAPDTSWSSFDVAELANSGSVRALRQSTTGAGIESDCLPATAGNRHRFAVQTLWLDAESSLDGRVQMRVEFHDQDDCGGVGWAAGTGQVRTEPDAWQEIGGYAIAPEGTIRALVTLWGWRDPGTGEFVAYFDDAELIDLPEPDAGLGAGCAIAALCAIRADARARSRRVTVRRTEDLAR